MASEKSAMQMVIVIARLVLLETLLTDVWPVCH